MEGRRGRGRDEQHQQEEQWQQGGEGPRPRKRAREEGGDSQPPSPPLSKGGKEEKGEDVYQRTVFVKKLDLNTTGAELKAAMGALLEAEGGKEEVGAVEELKLLTNKSGRFKGMATVTLKARPLVEAALRKGKLEGVGEDGTAAMIYPFNTKLVAAGKGRVEGQYHTRPPLPQHQQPLQQPPQQKEKEWHPTTVFLRGLLHWTGGEADLRSLFETHIPGSEVQAIAIVRDKRSGQRKGTALVQFTQPEPVAAALKMEQEVGKLIGVNEVVKVRRSRFAAEMEGVREVRGGREGGGDVEMPLVAASTGSLTAFAPRVLHRKAGRLGLGAGGGRGRGGGEQGGNLTQDDFKKMFMPGGGAEEGGKV